ncbi:MAG: hypothetical protein IPN01_35370 [Deltaproteobacteria bacterium]|nr:hypothetical protein [Deltaproteobacteria bacterium]
MVSAIVRETHVSDLKPGQQSRLQVALSYSDGFGREIQKKLQAESDAQGQRWVGSGWTIFDNKGQPVRSTSPFFTRTPAFEFDRRVGVSPVLFRPAGRNIGALHPDHLGEGALRPWRQETWDASDTVPIADP